MEDLTTFEKVLIMAALNNKVADLDRAFKRTGDSSLDEVIKIERKRVETIAKKMGL